jgi:1-acyl-sn-glycerol-3-phosphate acyltransferase
MTTEKNNGFLHNLRYFPRTFFVIFTLLIITFPVAAIIYLLTFITKDQQLFTFLIRVWANLNLWVSGLKINVTGLKNIDKKKQYIVIANHESALDIFLGLGKLPLQIRMVSKIGVKKLPIIGGLMTRSFYYHLKRVHLF